LPTVEIFDTIENPCIDPCMATKTISLELDAYERLRSAKTRERESFSAVVRRAVFLPAAHTGASILRELETLPPDMIDIPETSDDWENAAAKDVALPRVSATAWADDDAP